MGQGQSGGGIAAFIVPRKAQLISCLLVAVASSRPLPLSLLFPLPSPRRPLRGEVVHTGPH